MLGPDEATINGDAPALTYDRAIGELRHGRALQVVNGAHSLVVAAVEAIDAPALKRLAAASSGALTLLLTGERAAAAGYAAAPFGPVCIAVPAGTPLTTLHGLAGIAAGADGSPRALGVPQPPEHPALAAATVELAKVAKLVPALLAFDAPVAPIAGVLALSAADIEQRACVDRYRLELVSRARVPLADAIDCEIAVFREAHDLAEHVAVIIGRPNLAEPIPVRLHSACLTGDLLGSLRCDCGEQLRTAVARIASLGGGALLYLAQEGRGIGLPNKLRAYVLQDAGLDTVDADHHLGFLADERRYDVAAALLLELGIARVELMTNNPQKIVALREHGIDVVGRISLVASTNTHNERYLRAKLERAGHLAEDAVDGSH
jgi:GTP cyclohydrolase II